MTISIEEYKKRRSEFLVKMPENSVAIIGAAKESTRSRDTEYPFRQDSNFYYLTGFQEPDALLILSNRNRSKEVLFCRDKNKLEEIWHGRRLGYQNVKEQLGIAQGQPLSKLSLFLTKLVDGHHNLFAIPGDQTWCDELIQQTLSTLRSNPKKYKRAPSAQIDARDIIHEMRLFKSDAEIELMQQAAGISVRAHERAMKHTSPGVWEYQVEAEMLHEFASAGARFPAYNSIVGGGENACILHYTDNHSQLNDGELLLIDAGCEFQGYAADITRTFPVNGRFSKEQSQLYQLVLDAQHAAINHIKPGTTLKQATDLASKVITQGLIELGILSGDVDDNIKNNKHKDYFMHGLGHWLGLDVHDVGDYKIDDKERPFEPGMVLTVEPGIYIDSDADVAEKWHGIGIRVEDNILVTESGNRNLTQALVKEIQDIEELMANGR